MEQVTKTKHTIKVEAVSVKNRSIKTNKGWYAINNDNIDIKTIKAGNIYEVEVEKHPTENNAFIFHSFTPVQPPQQQQQQNNEPQKQNGQTQGVSTYPADPNNPFAVRDLHIARMSTLDKALQYMSMKKGSDFTLEDLFNIAEKMTKFVYFGPSLGGKPAPQGQKNNTSPGI